MVVVAGLVWLVRLRRDAERREQVRAWLEERRDQPGWSIVVRVAGPLWRVIGRPTAAATDFAARFGLARVRPGELGLELTTLVALFAVGAFTFFFVGDIVGEPGIPQIDQTAADIAKRLEMPVAIDVAKVLTWLGSLPVVIAVALATAVWSAMRRHWIDVVALVAGVSLSVILVHVSKAAYGRPRPEGGLIHATLNAYPSGHTTYAVTLVACATILVRSGVGWAARFAVVTVAVVAVVVVAATRVYLRVHFLTDVIGGAALGTAIWALVGTIALVAGYVRHNGAAR